MQLLDSIWHCCSHFPSCNIPFLRHPSFSLPQFYYDSGLTCLDLFWEPLLISIKNRCCFECFRDLDLLTLFSTLWLGDFIYFHDFSCHPRWSLSNQCISNMGQDSNLNSWPMNSPHSCDRSLFQGSHLKCTISKSELLIFPSHQFFLSCIPFQ